MALTDKLTAIANAIRGKNGSGATYTLDQMASKISAGVAGTPSVTLGTVSNNQMTVTPKVTNTEGYIAGGTKTGTAVTVKASQLVSGSQTVTENGTVDVTNLASLIVNVAGGGGGLPTGFSAIATGSHTLSADSNSSWTVTHNLGQVPDIFLIYRSNGNVATTYSCLWAIRCATMAYRASNYINYCGYHGNSTTSVSVANGTTRAISAVTSTTATITYYSSTTYYWRAGEYKWVAIKF